MSTSHPREVLGGQWRNGQWYSEDNAVDVPRRLTMGGVAFHLCYITEEEKRVLHRLYSMRDLPAPAGLEFVTERESGDVEVDSSDAVAKAPKAWISEPSHAKSLLVYVDDPTAAVLKRLDLHGSGVDKHDHFGPDRIPSYQGDGGGGAGDGGAGAGDGGGGDGGGDGGGGGGDYYVPPVTNTANTGPIPGSQITSWNATPAARQPIYNSSYTNYARPTTQFDTSMYGTQPVQSPLSASGASRENISNSISNWIANNPGADINTVLAAMRGSGINRTDIQAAGGVNNYGPSTQQTFNPFSTQPAQQTSMFGGQMQGGGYGQFGMNNPFSAYSNSFLNLNQNLNQGTQADKANAYRNAIQGGFGDQQIRNQAEGLFGQQSQQAWGNLQGSAMGMTPGLAQQSERDKIAFYQNARNQGFNDQTIRNAANQMIGNQSQSDWGYLQNKAGYGGGAGGYGNQFMPQMQSPFSQQSMPKVQAASGNWAKPDSMQTPNNQQYYGGYGQQMQSPFQGMTPPPPMQPPVQNPFSYQQPSYGPSQLPSYVYDTIRGLDQYQSQPVQAYKPTTQPSVQPYQTPVARSSGPSQAIVGRSSQMRGTPNVMRRAGGGIMSLMDDE